MRLRLALAVLTVAILGGAVVGYLVLEGRAADAGAQIVQDTTTPNRWKTIEYRGVRVDIPAEWVRVDRGDCEFAYERWSRSDAEDCEDLADGVSFYVSATFDPLHGPGLRRGDPAVDQKPWAGYAYAGEYAIYASGADRGVVATVLASVREAS